MSEPVDAEGGFVHRWNVPIDTDEVRIEGVDNIEFEMDEDGYMRGTVTFNQNADPEAVVRRLLADGWRYDEGEEAWIKG